MNEILTQEKSIYIQIKEMIEDDILRDVLLEEERVPSTNELARLYAINPATAAKGVNLLVDEGILYKKRGIGMFVATGAKAQIQGKRREQFYDNYVKSLMAEAMSLGITKKELVAMILDAKDGGMADEQAGRQRNCKNIWEENGTSGCQSDVGGAQDLRYDRKKRSRQDDLALYSDRAESGNKGRNTVEWDSGMGK